MVYVNSTGKVVTQSDGLKKEEQLPIYLYQPKGALVEAYILPIDTRGLWGKIYGYLALKNDGETVVGFTVYKHSETPGLGGEIEQRWFRNNFVNKKIVNPKGRFVSVSIAKGKVGPNISKEQKYNFVDGISGATLTGKFLTKGIKEILTSYEPVSVTLRNKNYYQNQTHSVPWSSNKQK